MDTTALPVRVTNRFRLAKRDDAGVIVEFVCFGEGRDTVTVTPTITSHAEAQDEADRINQINQAVIGTKDGVTEAFTKKVDSDITDNVLHPANGLDYKSIDDYKLHEFVTAAIQGFDCPNTGDVLKACGHPLLPI